MRLIAFLLISLIACGGDTAPHVPPVPPGDYLLTSIGGLPLPMTLQSGVRIIGGDVLVKSDGMTFAATVGGYPCLTNCASPIALAFAEGNIAAAGSVLTLTAPESSPITGSISGNGLSFPGPCFLGECVGITGDNVFVFRKQ